MLRFTRRVRVQGNNSVVASKPATDAPDAATVTQTLQQKLSNSSLRIREDVDESYFDKAAQAGDAPGPAISPSAPTPTSRGLKLTNDTPNGLKPTMSTLKPTDFGLQATDVYGPPKLTAEERFARLKVRFPPSVS